MCNVTTPCKGRAYWSSSTCQCECNYNDPTSVNCPYGTFDNNPNVCACPASGTTTPIICPPNQIWDPILQKCVCRAVATCNGRATWNSVICMCECKNTISCLAGYFDNSPNVCDCSSYVIGGGGIRGTTATPSLTSTVVPSN